MSPQTDHSSIWPCHQEPGDPRWKNPSPSPASRAAPTPLFYLEPAVSAGWKEPLMGETAPLFFHPSTQGCEDGKSSHICLEGGNEGAGAEGLGGLGLIKGDSGERLFLWLGKMTAFRCDCSCSTIPTFCVPLQKTFLRNLWLESPGVASFLRVCKGIELVFFQHYP